MAPADDDKAGGPFRGLPRPAAVLRRAKDANLPPPARTRDAPVDEETRDDEGVDAPRWEPAMRRDPRREESARPPPAAPPLKGSFAGLAEPTPAPRPGLLTPAERIEARKAIGIGADGLAAALGLGPNGERRVRRWEKPDPDPDDRPPPASIELLLRMAAEIPEAAAFLREHGRGALADRFRDRRPRQG